MSNDEVQFMTIKQIEGKDVTFIKIHNWVCAYVRFDNLPEEPIYCETYREGNVVGVDTAHAWNLKQSFNEKIKDAEFQISEIIKAIKE